MRIINIQQGSDTWLQERIKRRTASEAAAIFGDHKYMTRDQLLHLKHTGEAPEVSGAQQVIFDRGHQAEASARPIAERIMGDELYPCTAVDDDDYLLASMDGLTMLGNEGWECKLWNTALVERVEREDLEEHYKWQMDQQMAVTGADRILFMVTDGTDVNCVHCWYNRDEERIAKLKKGWEQFEKDLAEYSPKEQKVEVVAAAQADLPSPWAEVNGEITITDNLKQFGEALTTYVDSINLKPETDQDFADLDASCKKLKESEQKLTQCEEIALSKLDSVATLRTLISEYREKARQARLIGEKAVKAEKENRKNAIVRDAQEALNAEIRSANEEFDLVNIQWITADFYGAVKGLKTISSMETKCGDELARAKIALTEKRDHIRESLKIIDTAGADYQFLFSDKQQLVDKPHDHLQLLVEKRVSDHKAAEEARIQREAEARAKRMEEERIAEQRRQEQLEAERQDKAQAEQEAKESKPDADTPAPTANQSDPASNVKQMPSEKPRVRSSGSAPARPTDDQIIATLALHYRVHESKVIDWLIDMDLDSASERMAANI